MATNLSRQLIPIVAKSELPPCHAEGSAPEGYDGSEVMCQNCVDKFSCLPAAARNPRVYEVREAKAYTVADDAEVAAVLEGELSYDEAIERIAARDSRIRNGYSVPDSLAVSAVVAPKQTGVRSKPRTVPSKAKQASVPPPLMKATKANGKAGKATAKAMPTAAEKKKGGKQPRQPLARNGKPLPLPREISREQMAASLERIRLGKSIDFEIGHRIIRRDPEGVEHYVELRKNGYYYSGDKQTYPSLSAVAMIASGTPNRSGNDYYNLVTSRSTRITTKNGRVLADYKS